MPFTEEDKVVIKHYRLEKGYGAKRLLAEFPNKGWTRGGLQTLIEKIDATGSVDRQEGSVTLAPFVCSGSVYFALVQ